MNDSNDLAALDALLDAGASHDRLLDWVLERTSTPSGSIHVMGADGKLHLAAQRGLPDEMLGVIKCIPVGKGMAGLAAERREPVSLCNLQTDTSGDARPGAKVTGLRGTVAVPMLRAERDVAGVLGVGRPEEHTFEGAELDFLRRAADRIARSMPLPADP
ncbi:MAG TPA: GAF domain-containing protein [Planctomycetes bacterium]|nr:GAF domain-containing protein [Planctomycetota bacterium]